MLTVGNCFTQKKVTHGLHKLHRKETVPSFSNFPIYYAIYLVFRLPLLLFIFFLRVIYSSLFTLSQCYYILSVLVRNTIVFVAKPRPIHLSDAYIDGTIGVYLIIRELISGK